MKKYIVQTRYPDGEISLSVNHPAAIIDMFGFRDCTDCEFEVFDGSIFGSMVRLIEEPIVSSPFYFHRFINSATHEVEFEGFSKEH